MRKKLLRYGQTAATAVLAAAALMIAIGVVGFLLKVVAATGAELPISGLPVAKATVSASPDAISSIKISV